MKDITGYTVTDKELTIQTQSRCVHLIRFIRRELKIEAENPTLLKKVFERVQQ